MRARAIAVLIPFAISAVLAGCGVSSPQGSTLNTAPTASTYAAESVPTASELERLAKASPDRLIKNAPAEPGSNAIWPKPPKEDLGNFGKVEDTLWRGARPSDKGLEKLKAMGVKTIVNFENSEEAVSHEKAWAEANGVNFVSIPLSVVTPPKMENIKNFLKLAEDPTNRPLYFHCMQGRDRTGTAAFAYRISHDGWKYEKAYAEMKSYHFHTYLAGLRAFLVWYAASAAIGNTAAQPSN